MKNFKTDILMTWWFRLSGYKRLMTVCILSFAVLAIMSYGSDAYAQTASGNVYVEVPWQGERGIQETVGDIMRREQERQLNAGPKEHRIIPLRTQPGRKDNPQNPDSPETREWPLSRLPLNLQPSSSHRAFTPQTVSTINFTGATLADTGAFPPDSMGAAGPSQFIVTVNGRIRTFNKATGLADGALNVSMDTFFSSVMTPVGGTIIGNFTSDPHIRYDRLSGRWFVVMIDVPYTRTSPFTTSANRVMIAVSNGATITGQASFTFYQFKHDTVGTTPNSDTGGLADYPTPGIDANALYIGVNVFNAAGTAYVDSTGFVVRKSSIISGGPIVVTSFRGLVPNGSSDGPYTPQGVDNYDPAATEGYFIGVSATAYGRLIVRRVSNPGGTPTISANISLTVPSTASPITVPHLGNTGGASGNLDPVDDRLFAAHIRNGRLWTAHNIQVNSSGIASTTGGRNGTRWYEIQNLIGTPSVVQSGTLFDSAASNPKSYWIPSIMVSGQGHAALGFSTAGAANRANAGTVGRLSGDTLGAMQTPVDYTASSTAYNPAGDPGGSGGRRWGDYSYTSLDPNDDMTMWTIQEWCNATNSYGVQVVKLLSPPPAMPSSVTPASIPEGQSSVNVTVTGASSSGSGFFDPGAGFPNHIAAAVSGGVTVNSVTYTDPAHVTLNLSTIGASAGAQTVSITNPDGQSLTSASAILTVAMPTVQFQAASSSGSEAATPAAITVTLSAVSGQTVTVNYATANGTAIADSDYTAVIGNLAFNPGDTIKTINVPITNDTAVEGNETFSVTLSGPSNAALGAITTHTYTINNDDSFPDADGDSYTSDVDCDDSNPAVNPGATEIPNNGIDDDCNPATPILSASGSGNNYPVPLFRASLSLNVNASSLGTSTFTYYYTRNRLYFVSTSITNISVTGGVATITGSGNVNNVSGYTFTATITDGAADAMGLQIKKSDGTIYYNTASKVLSSGNFTIIGQ